MRKKTIAILTILVTLLFTINVNASESWEVYSTIEKGEDARFLYNKMPTEVQKGDTITVKLRLNDVQGWQISDGASHISWDKEAFEISEVDGKYYKIINDNIISASIDFKKNGDAIVYYGWNGTIAYENDPYLIELTFKVKKNIKDGIYSIRQIDDAEAITLEDNNNYPVFAQADGTSLRYQVGKIKISSNYASDSEEIAKGSYIIGNHLFTRTPSDEYVGYLTTKYIMLASKTIEGDSEDDMIIYYKNTSGNWVDGLTYEEISTPDKFEISYIDLKARYLENGVYSDSNNDVILELIQINDKEAIVVIEAGQEKVRGIANVNDKVVTLTVDDNSYTITLTDNGATISTSDTYISNKNLEKRANNSVNDYYNDNYGYIYDDNGNPVYYLNSDQTGKYTFGDYELNFLRVDEDFAKVCIKGKNDDGCTYDEYATLTDSGYEFGLDETAYKIAIGSSQAQITCEGNCNSPYIGTYSKESSLSMNDVFHIWEENRIQYRVLFNKNNGEGANEVYVNSNQPITSLWDWYVYYSEHGKDGYVFVEWQLNGAAYDFNTPVTKPITLIATYTKVPAAPVLSVPQVDGHDYQSYEDGVFTYDIIVNSADNYDAYNVYSTDNPDEPIIEDSTDSTISTTVAVNTVKTYYIKTYIVVDGEKYYSEASNVITLNPRVYEVSFNSKGGSAVTTQTIPYDGKVQEPVVPTKDGRTFVEWQLNGATYNFNMPVTANITLDALWSLDTTAPVLSVSETGSYYVRGLSINNSDNYCTSAQCDGSQTDEYSVEGFTIYESTSTGLVPVVEVAMGETYSLNPEPNTNKSYYAKLFVTDNNERIYGVLSNEIEVDATYGAPTLSYVDAGPNGSGKETYNFAVNASAYEYGSGYKVSGFDVFEVVNGEASSEPAGTIDTITGTVTINTNPDVVGTYVAKAYALDSNNAKVYSEASNTVSTLPTPVIAKNDSSTCNGGTCSVFIEVSNLSNYVHIENPEQENPYIITKLELYEVNGDDKTLIKTVTSQYSGTQVNFEMDLLDEKRVAAKVYALNGSNEEIASEFSNVVSFTRLSLLPIKNNIALSCDKSLVHAGDTLTCYVTPQSINDEEVIQYGYDITYSDDLELLSVNSETNASLSTNGNRNVVTLTDPASSTGTDSRIEYVLKVKDDIADTVTGVNVMNNNMWFKSSDNEYFYSGLLGLFMTIPQVSP